MKSKAAKKAADEDEAKSKKIRPSRGKRRRGRHSRSRSSSGSDYPTRKHFKKPTKKILDKKSKKNKGSSTSRRRRRSPSSSPSSVTRSHSRRSRHSSDSSSASERSASPPPRSRSGDARKSKGRGRDGEKDRKRRRTRRSRSSPVSSGSSRSRSRSKSKSRKRRAGVMRDDASKYRIVQDYDNCPDPRTEKNSIEEVDRDEEAVAVATKGMSDIDDYKKNVRLEKMESPPSKDSNETGEISSPKDANETDEILPAGSGSPEAEEDLELILRQKALENFRKFRGAAVMAGKTDSNGVENEVLTDSPQDTVIRISEARSAVTPFQRQGSSFGVSPSAGSPELEDIGNSTSPWKQETSHGDISRGILKAGDTSAPTQHQGSRLDATHSTSHITSQDGRNDGSVMQRLGSTSGSSASVKQMLGSSTGVSPVSPTPRVRSVVSIPTREGLDGDGGAFTMTPTACEDPARIESTSEVRHSPVEINKLEGTNGDDRKMGEASAPDSSVLSTDEGKSQAGTEDKDGSQFEKRTFSRMHDGETVQVSYKVYIPTKSPRLARRKLQR